jgi:hypothetical protein
MANASLSLLPLFPLRFVPPRSPRLPSSSACPCRCGRRPRALAHGGGSLLSPPPPASCRCCRPILVLIPVVILSSGSLSSFRCRLLTLVSRWRHCSHPSLSPLSCCPLVHHSSHLILCWPRHSCPVGPRFHPASSCSRPRSVVVLVVLVALVTLVVPSFLRSSSLSQFWLLVMGGHRWWGR